MNISLDRWELEIKSWSKYAKVSYKASFPIVVRDDWQWIVFIKLDGQKFAYYHDRSNVWGLTSKPFETYKLHLTMAIAMLPLEQRLD